MDKKIALISGITGQDGSFLAEFLIEKGYEVHGILRRSSSFNTGRIEHLYLDEWVRDMKKNRLVNLHYGDMTDSSSLIRIIQQVQPDEIYNLAAQSHVKVSFDVPEYTAEADAVGTLRMLEAVRILGLEKKTKIYQASTSELFGLVQEVPQKETTPFYPRSPYGVAKQYGFWITKNYRESYGMFAVNGILFNHESERRGETFVTRKITLAAARIAQGYQDKLYLGNLNSLRDWGYAKDYVECMWLILQNSKPEDFVIATGEQHSVREFATLAFRNVGINLRWEGEGIDEKGIERNEVTLHVGAGTFKPVKSEEIAGHTMHAEWIAVKRESIERLIAHGGWCIAVGTTSVRTLESLYYVGVMIHQNPNATADDLHVPQWMPYEYAASEGDKLTTLEALQEIADWMDRNALPVLHTSTQIIIAPGYDYHIVRTIVTNFHQPKSTLLLLVSAFVKGDWHRIYDYALANNFRFLSYGDSSLLNY